MTQLIYCHVVALVVVEKSAARQIATTIYSLRICVENMVSQIFKKAQKRSISWHITHARRTQVQIASGGDRSPGQAGSRLRDQLGPPGIRQGSTAGSSRVRRAGWLGSSWQQRASPQRASRGSGGVALPASTPATPEL